MKKRLQTQKEQEQKAEDGEKAAEAQEATTEKATNVKPDASPRPTPPQDASRDSDIAEASDPSLESENMPFVGDKAEGKEKTSKKSLKGGTIKTKKTTGQKDANKYDSNKSGPALVTMNS